jgi:protein-S-isoprenylcysteine O-methyltransferase Ste14
MMTALELKIPPVLVAVITAALMWITSVLTAELSITTAIGKTAALLLLAMGTGIGLAGVVSFKKARTTVNPLKPETSSVLVDSGVFRFTRNPMYLALLLALLAWGLMLNHLWPLVWAPVFVCYMNRFQIQPEERALEKQFGKAFLDYKNQVRRWL